MYCIGTFYNNFKAMFGLNGLRVKCSRGNTSFSSSNPAEVYGFFQEAKLLRTNFPKEPKAVVPSLRCSDSEKNFFQTSHIQVYLIF